MHETAEWLIVDDFTCSPHGHVVCFDPYISANIHCLSKWEIGLCTLQSRHRRKMCARPGYPRPTLSLRAFFCVYPISTTYILCIRYTSRNKPTVHVFCVDTQRLCDERCAVQCQGRSIRSASISCGLEEIRTTITTPLRRDSDSSSFISMKTKAICGCDT